MVWCKVASFQIYLSTKHVNFITYKAQTISLHNLNANKKLL